MKNVGTWRDTVTWSDSFWIWPLTGSVYLVTVTVMLLTPTVNPLRFAAASARSVASLPAPAGMESVERNCLGMKITPARAAEAAALSASVL